MHPVYRLVSLIALTAAISGGIALARVYPTAACILGTSRQYPSANGSDFKVAQTSQGGNYYYGTAGTLTPAPPNDPTANPNYAQDHINSFFGSVDARYKGSTTPGLIHGGWAIGFHKYNNTHFGTPTVVAETFAYSLNPVIFPSGAASAGSWYKTQLTFGNPNGMWHYEAWFAPSGQAWSLLGSVDLTTSTSESQAFGEVSDPGTDLNFASTEQCISVNSSMGSPNAFHSMQLYVNNSTWQNWTAANGRWACAQSENPYRPLPSTINADCTQGTLWDVQYTDFTFGGP